jgi:hypothetical protein
MTEKTINEEQLRETYEALKTAPASIWENTERANLAIVAKVAHECDFEAFKDFVLTEEVPPIELSDEQLELINGGGLALVPILLGWALHRYVLPK